MSRDRYGYNQIIGDAYINTIGVTALKILHLEYGTETEKR